MATDSHTSNTELEPWLAVEWDRQPEWMLNAAIAFDAALKTCDGPDDADPLDKIVVYISVFRESQRPAHCNGVLLRAPGASV